MFRKIAVSSKVAIESLSKNILTTKLSVKPNPEPEQNMHLQVEGLAFETLGKSSTLYFKSSS